MMILNIGRMSTESVFQPLENRLLVGVIPMLVVI